MTDDLIRAAREYATQAHPRVFAPSSRPFANHLKEVAQIVASVSDDEEAIAAAWLHDAVEKTPATHYDLERAVGEGVAALVREITPISRPSDGGESLRAAIDREHLARASARAQTVKLADWIDTLRAARKEDLRRARAVVAEASLAVEVLREGDVTLRRRVDREIDRSCQRLGIERPPGTLARLELTSSVPPVLPRGRAQRLFLDAFSARDLAEGLRSFDADRDALAVATVMQVLGLELVGVRQEGTITGFVRRDDLADGALADFSRAFARDQIVADDASLSEVVLVLSRNDYCFVAMLDSVIGVVRRCDIEKPVVRMWLFGMITIVEMNLADRIEARFPDGSWRELLSPSRLAKAEKLCAERARMAQSSSLVDCLQLADKASILLKLEEIREEFGFTSKAHAERVVRDLGSLRDNLAHGQSIVAHDWPQIIRMTGRLTHRPEGIVAAPSRTS